MNEDTGEKLPSFSVAEIARWRTKLRGIFRVCDDMIISESWLASMTYAVVNALVKKPKKSERSTLPLSKSDVHVYNAVYYTLLAAVGCKATPEVITRMVNVLAGNVHELKAGSSIPVWRYQTADEWVLAKIVDSFPTITPRKQIHGHNLVVEVLTGHASSYTINQFVTDGMLNRMARRLGVRSIKNRRPVHPRELTMLYMYVKLKKGEKLEINEYRERSGLNARNRSRAVQRDKYKELCPIDSKWPCVFCRMGYAEDCQLATHKDTYVRGTCKNGHMGWIKPGPYVPTCMACQQRRWAAKHGGSYVKEESESSSVCPEPCTVS